MDKALDAIVADLIRETASWDSIEARVVNHQTVHFAIGPTPPHSGQTRDHYIETSRGQRFYRMTPCGPDKDCSDMIGYRDGGRCAYVECKRPPDGTKQKTIVLTKTFMDEQSSGFKRCPTPLRFDHVGLIPLHEAIPKAIRKGVGRIIGRDCDVFLFHAVPTNPGTCELIYHLDAATSVPLKVEIFRDEAGVRAGKPGSTWEATSLDEVQGFHVPLRSKYVSFRGDESTPMLSEIQVIESLTFNGQHDPKTFWPTYEPGVYINDLITRTDYYYTPTKKALPEVTSATTTGGAPIVARAPTDMMPWLTGGGLGVGALLILVGLIHWARRR